jgi:CDP-glucose 4,6-dehydratase
MGHVKTRSEFAGFYAGRQVLVTGTTGFQGSWLALWLTMLGANVTGFALHPPDDRPSLFANLRLHDRIQQVYGDVTDQASVRSVIASCRPEIILHLAAQPIVRESIEDPVRTFEVNVLGTANVLASAREARSLRAIVCVTSDKCYKNEEFSVGHIESDPLGGDDPYSASKAAAELVTSAFRATVYPFFSAGHIGIASARASNVIGGGDWSSYRLVPDIVRWAFTTGQLSIRNPQSIRPWQHVLEALSGYLLLASCLVGGSALYCSAWNFGPDDTSMVTVQDLTMRFAVLLGREIHFPATPAPQQPTCETAILRLDSRKADELLGWRATWTLQEALDATARWYQAFYSPGSDNGAKLSECQIEAYCDAARRRQATWALT